MLIYTKNDPRFYDKRLYKGGDGGAGDLRAQEGQRQANQQKAIDAINVMFGKPSSAQRAAPTRAEFTTPARIATEATGGYYEPGGGESGDRYIPGTAATYGSSETFNEAAFNKANADYEQALKVPQANAAARTKMYDDIQGAVTQTNMRDLDRQFTQANSANLIGLARAGQTGSSIDAASGGQLQERYGEGKLRATSAGLGASADLRTADEKTRQNLIGLAQSGLDAGTAAGLASSQMEAASKTAQAQSNTANLGRLFDDISNAYVQENKAKVTPAAYQPYVGGSLFSGRGYSGRQS